MRANASSGTSQVGISCHQLLWGCASAVTFANTVVRSTVRDGTALDDECKQHDDSDDDDMDESDTNTSVDLIMGSDLIYVPQVIRPLFETVQILLRRNDRGRFLMAHSNRRGAGNAVEMDMVWNGAREAGLETEWV